MGSIPVLYLSAAHGSDGNSGLSPAQAIRSKGEHDRRLMQGQRAWRGKGFTVKALDWSGPFGSLDAYDGPDHYRPATLDFTHCPYFSTEGKNFIEASAQPDRPARHVVIKGVKCWPGEGLYANGMSFNGPFDGLTITDCDLHGFGVGISADGGNGRGRKLVVRRNVITDCRSESGGHCHAVIVGHWDGGLFERNVIDRCGLTKDNLPGDIFSAGVYINPDNTTDMVPRFNIVARGCSNAFRSGGTVCEDNIILANYGGIVAAAAKDAQLNPVARYTRAVRRNLILDSAGDAGLGISIATAWKCEVSYNTIAHRSTPCADARAITIQGDCRDVDVHHNSIYRWGNPGDPRFASGISWFDKGERVTVRDNRIVVWPGGRPTWTENAQYTPVLKDNSVSEDGPAIPTVADFMASFGKDVADPLATYMAGACDRQPWAWDLPAFVRKGGGA